MNLKKIQKFIYGEFKLNFNGRISQKNQRHSNFSGERPSGALSMVISIQAFILDYTSEMCV